MANHDRSTGSSSNRDSSARDYHSPATVAEVTERNVEAVVRLEHKARTRRTASECFAEAIARFCGSMAFVWAHVVWFTLWVLVNFVHGFPHFDPYPFTFLTFCVSLEAIFLSTFILISQNLETRQTERRNHLDLQINLLTEQEITKVLSMLNRIAEKVGAEVGDDPYIQVLEKATRPDELAEQIDEATEKTAQGRHDRSSPSTKEKTGPDREGGS